MREQWYSKTFLCTIIFGLARELYVQIVYSKDKVV